MANQLANFPLNFLRTGYYGHADGKVHVRTTNGSWWSNTDNDTESANFFYTYPTSVYPQGNQYRGYAFALRCKDAETMR